MKDLKRVVGIVLAGLLMGMCVGCVDDDDDDLIGGSILGRWLFNKAKAALTSAPLVSITVGKSHPLLAGLWADITFNADLSCSGRLFDGSSEQAFAGRYTTAGNQLTVVADGETVTGEYGVTGTELTFKTERRDSGVDYDLTVYLDKQ